MCYPRRNSSRSETPIIPDSVIHYEKYLKIARIVIVLAMLIGFIWYSSDRPYHVLRNELDSLSGHITTLETFLKRTANKKGNVEKYLMDLISAAPQIKEIIPQIKEMAGCMRSRVDKCGAGAGNMLKAMKSATKDCCSVRNMIREEIEQYSADKTGRADYALESSGGTILNTRNTKSYGKSGPALSLFGIPLCQTSNSPRALLQPGVMPGECWAFSGHCGAAVIRLVKNIYVTGFSLEHIPKNISPTGNTNNAPKEFSVWGLKCENDLEGFFFGQYKYETCGPSVQYFPVKHKSTRTFNTIEFKVHSNHGHPEYTCVYRLRVHGDLRK